MTTRCEENKRFFTEQPLYERRKRLRVHKNTFKRFKKISLFHAVFKYCFWVFFAAQLFIFIFFFPSWGHSSIIAVHLGGIFLTVFTYFVLLFYFQAKKPEQFLQLKEKFITACRRSISSPVGVAEHHLIAAQTLLHFISHLHHCEYRFYPIPRRLSFLRYFSKRLSSFFHFEDVFRIREMFYFSAIEEHLQQIRLTPTDLEVHASLAHCYVSFSKFYLELKRSCENRRWLLKNETTFEEKFQDASQCAIEELKILKHYAPNDPWVHAQLAKCYHCLNMMEEEADEYAKILELSPHDLEVKFRLAKIYFQLGSNAKGLILYEELKKKGHKNAHVLLNFYSASKMIDFWEEDSY